VGLERHRVEHGLKKRPGHAPIGLLDQLRDGELAGPVDGHEEIEFPLGGVHLGNVPSRQIAAQSPTGRWMWTYPIG